MPDQDTVLIPLRARDGSIRAYAIVDATDAEWLNQWRWSFTHGYAARYICVEGKRSEVRMHRSVLNLPLGRVPEVDHINRDRLDNRKANLRTVTRLANMQNQPASKSAISPYRNVSWHKGSNGRRDRWCVDLCVEGKRIYIGSFRTEAAANEAAIAARRQHMPYATE